MNAPASRSEPAPPSAPASPSVPATPAETMAGKDAAVAAPASRPHLGLDGWLAAATAAGIGTLLRVLVVALFARANDTTVRHLLTKWDSRYYQAIAEEGYFPSDLHVDGPVHHFTMAFFPGYPFLVRLVSWTGLPTVAASVLVSIAATVALAAAAMQLTARLRPEWRDNRAIQAAAACVVTSAPMSIVFAMPYTEALFGALALWALVAMCDKRWLWAGALTAAAATTRLTAVDLIATLAVAVLIWGRTNPRAWAGLVVSPVPLLGYLAYANHHLADAGGYFGIQEENWSSGFDFGSSTVTWLAEKLFTSDEPGYLLSCLAMLAAPILLIAAWRRVPWPVWIFSALLTANVLLSGGIMHSRPRLLLPVAVLLVPFIAKLGHARPKLMWITVAAWMLLGAWFSGYMLGVFRWAI